MAIGCKLSDDAESSKGDESKYKSNVGVLLYLATTSLYIMRAICLAARFQQDSKETHVAIVKRIFTFLKKIRLWIVVYKKIRLHFDGLYQC